MNPAPGKLMLTVSMRAILWPTALLLTTAAAAGDWPQWRGPQRDGVAVGETISTTFPGDGPQVLWRRGVGPGHSSPIVGGDRLYLFHQDGTQEAVECLSAADGKTLWTAGNDAALRDMFGETGPRATPVLHDQHLYTLGGTGFLQCLDAQTGKQLWKHELGREYSIPPPFFGVGSSPLVEGDKLIVLVGGKRGAGLVAFDRATGKVVWQGIDDEASYSSPVAATLDGQRRLLAFARTGLHLVDPATGKGLAFFRWRARINASVNAATPVIVDNQTFISSSYNTGSALLKIGPQSLEPVWSHQDGVLASQYDSPVFYEGHLYGTDGRSDFGDGKLQCVEWATGTVKWSEAGFGCASVIRVGNTLLTLSERGALRLVRASPAGYELLATAQPLKGTVRAMPALANGRLYLRDDLELLCLDLRS